MKDDREDAIEFCIQSCHLLECLYDPYFTWRYFKRTDTLTPNTQHYKTSSAAFLHIEVVPFIFGNHGFKIRLLIFSLSILPVQYFSEYFEQKISTTIPLLAFELLNVLGAVVSGSQVRSYKIILIMIIIILNVILRM